MQLHRLNRREVTVVGGAAARSLPCISGAAQKAAAAAPHRRELLQSLLAIALAMPAGWHNDVLAATLPLGRDRFVEMSEKLCAMSIEDRSFADAIQNALVTQHAAADFRRLAELVRSAAPQDVDQLVASSGLADLAKSIASVWYSGLLGTGHTARVLFASRLSAFAHPVGRPESGVYAFRSVLGWCIRRTAVEPWGGWDDCLF